MLLTETNGKSNLDSPFPHEAVGIEAPCKGQKAAFNAVFYCPSFINKGLVPVKSFMIGCIEQSLIGLAVPLCGSFNLIQSIAQRLKLKSGGLSLNKGHKPMNTHAQKQLTANVSEKFTSRFNVISKTGRSIARKVPFSTAIRLKNNQPELSIKFDSMVGVA